MEGLWWLWILLPLLCIFCCCALCILLCFRRKKAKDMGEQILMADILAMPAFIPPPPMDDDGNEIPMYRRLLPTHTIGKALTAGIGGIKRLVLTTEDVREARKPSFHTHVSSTSDSVELGDETLI